VPAQFHLERSGTHGAQRTTVSRRGIHPELVEEVDALFLIWGVADVVERELEQEVRVREVIRRVSRVHEQRRLHQRLYHKLVVER